VVYRLAWYAPWKDDAVIDPGLDGRVALVTGANHGIGAAVGVALAAEGARVLLTYLRLPAEDKADEVVAYPVTYGEVRARAAVGVVDTIVRAGGEADSVEADLADPAVPTQLFDQAEDTFGPVEILVNNASGWLANTFAVTRTRHDRFGRLLRPVDAVTHERQFAVDTRASALLIAEFARRHIQQHATWGRIIGLTSSGSAGFPEEVSYGAAKAAQESYTMSAAQELGRFGITANLVHPPATDTGWVTPEVEKSAIADSPLRHVAKPEDVAEVVLFLASHQARCVTAQVLRMH
jgi:3-oxoacyl-[acyl-carrier protein] reductase